MIESYEKFIDNKALLTLIHNVESDHKATCEIERNEKGGFNAKLDFLKLTDIEEFNEFNLSHTIEEFKLNIQVIPNKLSNWRNVSGDVTSIIAEDTVREIDEIQCILNRNRCFVWFNPNNYWTIRKSEGNTRYTIKFQLDENIIVAKISPSIDSKSVLIDYIESEFRKVCALITFCRAKESGYSVDRQYLQNTLVRYQYKKTSNTIKTPDLINPFRNEHTWWEKFIKSCIDNQRDLKFYIDEGIFQAIFNLNWPNKITELHLISLCAALEGLCPNQKVLDKNNYKAIRRSGVAHMKQEAIKLNIEEDVIAQLMGNFNDNDRILNNHPTAFAIKLQAQTLNLQDHDGINFEGIKDAFKVRNKYVHKGMNSNWEKPLTYYIYILRDAINTIILKKLNYRGKWFKCDPKSTHLFEL